MRGLFSEPFAPLDGYLLVDPVHKKPGALNSVNIKQNCEHSTGSEH